MVITRMLFAFFIPVSFKFFQLNIVSLMALNDTFTIQEMDLDTKDLSYNIKAKEIEAYWNKECEKDASNYHFKIFYD